MRGEYMILFNKTTSYESNYFSNNVSMLEPKIIFEINDKLRDLNLFPNFIPLLEISTPPTKKMIPELSSNDDKLKIIFFPDKIAIINSTLNDADKNLGSFVDFMEKATEIYEKILDKRTSNRISVIEQCYSIVESRKYENVYSKLFIPCDFYEKYMPFEWDYKLVGNNEYIINNLNEKINCITNLMARRNAINENTSIIKRTIDINTTHLETNFRFQAEQIRDFIEQAKTTYIEITNSVNKILNGDANAEIY
jgi:hypothetical protein